MYDSRLQKNVIPTSLPKAEPSESEDASEDEEPVLEPGERAKLILNKADLQKKLRQLKKKNKRMTKKEVNNMKKKLKKQMRQDIDKYEVLKREYKTRQSMGSHSLPGEIYWKAVNV